jgi:hypothetical protein
VFSSAGLTVTSLRNRLTEDQAGRLVFLAGSWETVAQLSRAAAAAGAGAGAAAGSSAGCSSARGATATCGNITSRSESDPVRSVADQRAALDVAAAALSEGTHAAPWSNGGGGMGEGVPRKRKRKKAGSSRGSGSNSTAAAARQRKTKPADTAEKGQQRAQGGKGKGKKQLTLSFKEASSGSDASDDSNVSGVSVAVTRKATSKPT